MSKRPDHLFVGCSGDLYDTRVSGWFNMPPLRAGYTGGGRDLRTFAQVKAALRDIGETFGYTPYYITDDGAALCEDCVRKNLRLVCDSVTHDIRDGWRVTGATLTDADDYMPMSDGGSGILCDNCGEWIAEPEPDEAED